MFSDLGDSFAEQLNFRNFSNFAISVTYCFALFHKSCLQVSQILVSQGFAITSFAILHVFHKVQQGFADTSFASFRKYKFSKVLQIGFSFCKV